MRYRSFSLWGLRLSLCRHRADDPCASAIFFPLVSPSLFPSPCPSVFSLLSLPLASPADSNFRSAAVCGRVSRLFRLYFDGVCGGACASSFRVSRRVPWAVHLRVAEPRPGGSMAMNYNAKDEVDGGPPCAPGGTAKNRRPDNTAFKQQRLPAWQPILTAGTVLPTFFIIGLIFIPIGIGIFVTSNNIREIEVRGGSGGGSWRCVGAGSWPAHFLLRSLEVDLRASPTSHLLSLPQCLLSAGFLNLQLCLSFLSRFTRLETK